MLLIYRVAVQQSIAISISIAILLVIEAVVRLPGMAPEIVFSYIVCLTGLYWGAIIPRAGDGSLRVARYVWILPVAFWLYQFYAIMGRHSLDYAMRAFFHPVSADEDGLAQFFLTVPTATTITYSIGAALAHPKRQRSALPTAR